MVNLRKVVEGDETFPRTIFVHMGSATASDVFFSEYWPEALAIGDPKQKLYRAFGITWGSVGQFFRPDVWKAYLSARSFGIGKPHGNTMRNPGVFLIKDKEVLFSQEIPHIGVQVDIYAVRQAMLPV